MSNEFNKHFDDLVDQRGPATARPSTGGYAVSHPKDRQAISQMVTMLKRAQVEKILNLSRSAIYARMDRNSDVFDTSFPTPVRYGDSKSVFWVAEEISAWLEAQIRRTRSSGNDARSHKPGGAA